MQELKENQQEQTMLAEVQILKNLMTLNWDGEDRLTTSH